MTARLARAVLVCIAIVLAVALTSFSARAEDKPLRGVALIIGNGDYPHLPKLANPENDADAIEALFSDLGFDSVRRADRDAATLRRDLERFAEDAEDADVAVLYYSGHGIEAGGENYLVPVDADISALDAAGEKLVPVSALIAELQAAVPVVIVMLDACRDNPFPAGATVRAGPDAQPLPVGTAGLGETRGATSLRADAGNPKAENVGTVLAFAAEPGKVALDGDAGANSPYAAAVLRHLSAMAGEEFGTVMRMVAEEVYLKTAGKQRPWVNESLRRLLYFGSAPDAPAGVEGDILTERRRLLVTIAALPDLERRQVETAAAQAGVPMDALFGMLNVLGADAPTDPEQLDAVLRSQTERLKQILSERQALKSADPEITRLSALADQAIADGALATALAVHEQAKARVKDIEGSLQQAADDLTARFVEAADVYARSAQTYEIAFDYGKAAGDYAEALRLVERWDGALAWKYANAGAFALNRHYDHVGGREVAEQAIAAARQAVALASRTDRPVDWASSQANLSYALRTLGIRDGNADVLREGRAALRAALEAVPRQQNPIRWARTQAELALVVRDLAIMTNDPALLEEALAAYALVLEELRRDRDPREWAMVQNNLGNALTAASAEFPAFDRLNGDAIAAFRSALEVLTPQDALFSWTLVQNNLAGALAERGRLGDGAAASEAVHIYRAVLAQPVRDRQPRQWARAQSGLGQALNVIGTYGYGTAELVDAARAFRAALEVYTRERDPLNFGLTQHNLGTALITLGQREQGTERFAEAVTALRAAAEEYARRKSDRSSMVVAYYTGNALRYWAERETGTERLEEAAVAYRQALALSASTGWQPYVPSIQTGLGEALLELSRRQGSLDTMKAAAEALRAATGAYETSGDPGQVASARERLGRALLELGERSRNAGVVREGRDALSAAWDFYKAQGMAGAEEHFQGLLARADAALKALGG